MKILKARFLRFWHGLWWSVRPWLWLKNPPCRAVTHTDITPGQQRVVLVSCTCGKVWYREPGYDETQMVKAEVVAPIQAGAYMPKRDREGG